VDSQALQQSIINLFNGYSLFFKGHAESPKFKNKYNVQSFRNPHGSKIKIENGKLFQPKFREGINLVIDRQFTGKIRSTTISRTPTGKYFVSVLVDTLKKVPKPVEIKPETATGIDLGLKSFMVTSEGLKFEHPKHLQKSLSHLKYLSRQHSKKNKGSKNKNKSRIKLALCHEKIANQRKDFLHKLSTNLVKSHDTLCFESLKIENMIRNRRLARSIHSSGWGNLLTCVSIKASGVEKMSSRYPLLSHPRKYVHPVGTRQIH
jgi:putative transposase